MGCPGRIGVVCDYVKFTPRVVQRDRISTSFLSRAIQHQQTDPTLSARIFDILFHTHPEDPDILLNYAIFLEEQGSKQSNHFYLLAFHYGRHKNAYEGYKRTLKEIQKEEEENFYRITQKSIHLSKLSTQFEQQVAMDVLQIYHTNAIEGSTLSLADTQYILETSRVDDITGSLQEVYCVVGVRRAINFIRQLDKKAEMTEETILRIHYLFFSSINYKVAGVYRSEQVYVGSHTPPPPEDVPQLMRLFVEWLQSAEFRSLHPIEGAALAHFELVWIHPFVDGNGRTARMLMNLILRRSDFPEAVIRKESSSVYYDALEMANPKVGGDTRPFVKFIGDAVESTIDDYLALLPKTHEEL
eukprot:TRINITY_DN13391_c0_g2_i1.p1 TRINITY_DN13391_c0_g2~~TRINITY_DN13391_c0_g2_i1.p1  ORF type:complete len:380 (-),score=64.37 TRINITY_DN13391_c0_g2_i1:69-1139(-)